MKIVHVFLCMILVLFGSVALFVKKDARSVDQFLPVTHGQEMGTTRQSLAAPSQPYAGRIVPPYPEGIEAKGSRTFQNNPNYRLDFVSKGQDLMVWLTRRVDPSESGIWKVLDSLSLGQLTGDMIVTAMNCQIEGKLDPEIMAVSRFDWNFLNPGLMTNHQIAHAWRASLNEGIFKPVPTQSVVCSVDL